MLKDKEIQEQIVRWTNNLVAEALGTPRIKINFDFVTKPSRIAGYFKPGNQYFNKPGNQYFNKPGNQYFYVILGFNIPIARENWDDYYNTVVHEVAHLIDYVRNGYAYRRFSDGRRDSHGAYFKSIMRELGEEPSTYHTYKMPNVRRQHRWEYACNCKTHAIATVTHNRIQRGQVRICNTCKGELTFTGVQLS